MTELERRYTQGVVSLRLAGERKRIGGYAAVFERDSQNLGGFIERVAKGFFNDSRSRGWPDVIARYNHDDNMLLGTTGAGTLSLEIDETGLLYEVDPPAARADIRELVERGDLRKSSFAFRTLEDEWTVDDKGFPLRTLRSGALVDVAPVNSPAYLDTSVGLRSLAEKVGVPLEEVRSFAAKDELRKFLVKTGTVAAPAKQKTLGAAARMELLAREQDPYV